VRARAAQAIGDSPELLKNAQLRNCNAANLDMSENTLCSTKHLVSRWLNPCSPRPERESEADSPVGWTKLPRSLSRLSPLRA
jgi:hypothetical protein